MWAKTEVRNGRDEFGGMLDAKYGEGWRKVLPKVWLDYEMISDPIPAMLDELVGDWFRRGALGPVR